MGIFTPIVPLEFDASFSYIQRLMHLCEKLNEQGVSINTIQEYLNSLDIDQKIKDEVFKQFVETPNLKPLLEKKKILLIGDSYTAGVGLPEYTDPATPPTTAYGNLLKGKGIDITVIGSPGAGFYWVGDRGNFKDCLSLYTGDKSEITDIYILGGSNDYSLCPTALNLQSQIILTCNEAHKLYPNAKISIGWLSQMNYDIDYKKWNEYMSVYKNNAINGDYSVIPNTEFILKRRDYISPADLLHPTVAGHQAIANALMSYIRTGSIEICETFNNLQLTKTDAVRCDKYTLNFSMNQNQTNGLISIDNQQQFGFVFNSEFPITLSGQLNQGIYLGSLDNGLIWGRNTTDKNSTGIFPAYTPTAINIPVELTTKEKGVISVTGRLVFEANNVFLTMEHKPNEAIYDTVTPKQIDIPPFTGVLNANLC